ncbi:MAG: hypothetical protein A2W34_03685 [Chloroflexi bacterium RBG_16_64_32]|nr:MAG: hypothetical protein A2W34_03685 [Chloroflexi bacterium RBG_16_64_32]
MGNASLALNTPPDRLAVRTENHKLELFLESEFGWPCREPHDHIKLRDDIRELVGANDIKYTEDVEFAAAIRICGISD